jgi:formate--tetrahydrofolate ligase
VAFRIKCRTAGLQPAAAVLVVTHRAVAVHGIDNVRKHVENIRSFGVPVVVSVNRFLDDPPEELERLRSQCEEIGIPAVVTDYREAGGEGGLRRPCA